jgi:hypothetical protein
MTQTALDHTAATNDDEAHVSSTYRGFLADCWRGRARAWQAFWIVLVAGSFMISLLNVPMGIAASLMYRSGQTVPALAVFFLPSIVGLCWLVFALVGVWRCAPNADLAVSRIASRVAVVVVVAAAIVQLMPGIEAGQQSIAEQRARAAAEASQGR